jgi:hypothetical protein
LIRRLTAGTVRWSADAASVKLSARATTTNASIDLKEGIRLPMRFSAICSWRKYAAARRHNVRARECGVTYAATW